MRFLREVIAIGCMAVWAGPLQGQSASFDWESARVALTGDRFPADVQGSTEPRDPGYLRYHDTILRPLLEAAYSLPVEGPDWLDAHTYDIDAKIPADAAGQPVSTLLRSLLAARFHVTAHPESKPVLQLIRVHKSSGLKEWIASPKNPALPPVGRGDKLRYRKDRDGYPLLPRDRSGVVYTLPDRFGRRHFAASQQPLSKLIEWLQNDLGPIEDGTGLTGKYTFTLDFYPTNPDDPLPPVGSTRPPGLFTALQEQLGLKLEQTGERADVLVVDAIDENP